MGNLSPLLDHYLAEFARVERDLPGANDLRKAALKRFIDAGFPSSSDEHWKYSDTRPLQKAHYELAEPAEFTNEQLEALYPENLDAYLFVFVNGRLAASHSQLSGLPDGVMVNSLAAAMKNSPEKARALNQGLNGHGHALSDLNMAFASDGAMIEITENTKLDKPIYLLSTSNAACDHAAMIQIRHLLKLGKNAQATVIEHQVALDNEAGYYSSSVMEISLAANAHLKRCRIQMEASKAFHTGVTHARLSRDSQFHNHSVDLGGRWVRHDTVINLAEPGAEIHLDGLYVPTGRQHMDNQTRVDHSAPHCISREDYKGILNGHSRGVFNGKIVVHKDAQQTDSEQSSAALLLSGHAEVDAKPELEIYADDVKCAHGATVGQLDEQAVFYLQSRGLDESDARNLLTYSFADELIQRVGIEPLRKHIEESLLAKLPNSSQLQDLL